MKVSKETRGKLLFAQFDRLFELSRAIKGFVPDYEATNFAPSEVRGEDGRLVLFSGVFVAPTGMALLPFSLGFSALGMDGVDTGLSTMALVSGKVRGPSAVRMSTLALLSVLDYLNETGTYKCNLKGFIARFTKGGQLTERVDACRYYEAFKVAAIKMLPYDLSMEFLEAAAA
jgi:hypothetical protein